MGDTQTNDAPAGKTPLELSNDPEFLRYGYDIKCFARTFQKPTNIYKFLRYKWKESPFCLSRNLSYINKHRRQVVVPRCKKIDLIAKNLKESPAPPSKINNNKNLSKILKTNLKSKDAPVPKVPFVNGPLEESEDEDDKVCYYNWICTNSTRQMTKTFGLICPWCERDFQFLDSLMMHLRCYHPRLQFSLMERQNETIINVTLNLAYDNTYVGFKYPGHDLRNDFRFTTKRPSKRRRDPNWLDYYFFKARKRPFVDNPNVNGVTAKADNNDVVANDYYENCAVSADCGGRLYYHTTTCLPIKPKELDMDSEADTDPLWLRQRTQLMIDEFTDVNEGEKEIMKMWNLHLMENYQHTADHMMAKVCSEFVDKQGKQIIAKNLLKNFVLHLINLYNFGLLSSIDVLSCIRKLRNPAEQTQQENQLSNSNNLNRNRNLRPLSNGLSTHS